MAKVLIFYAGKKNHLQQFAEAAKKRHLPVKIATYTQLNFQSDHPGLRVGEEDLRNFDLIYLRLVGQHREELTLIADYAKKHHISLVDKILETGSIDRKKSFEIRKLVEAGLAYPKTIFARLERLESKGEKEFSFPFIIKRTDGKQGKNVYLVRDSHEVKSLVKKLLPEEKEGKRFLAQELIANDGDFRLMVIGGRVIGAIKRTAQKKGEFRSNVSLGGKAEKVEVNQKLKEMAIKAATLCQVDFAGVDIILDKKTQKPYLLEINRAPQYAGFHRATGINVPMTMIDYLCQRLGHKVMV
jgi:RimK family alpha-L-glutamate ligase